MENKNINISINDLIILCHILDSYNDFNQELINLMSSPKFNLHDLLLSQTNRKNILCNRETKKFYLKYKDIFNIINNYNYLLSFIVDNYIINQNNITRKSKLDFFYQYIMNNKNSLEKIFAVLNRMKELGFNKLKFDENLDFTASEYKVNKLFYDNANIEYLDNMEAIPNYQSDIVKYKTTDSNYKVIIVPSITIVVTGNISEHDKKIVVNSLVFDANRLPNSISTGSIFNEILALKNSKSKECNAIKNSIDLNLNMEGLISEFISTDNTINQINDIENKNELLTILAEVREKLNKLKVACSKHDDTIVNMYPTITPDILQKEKKLCLERIKQDKIDTY